MSLYEHAKCELDLIYSKEQLKEEYNKLIYDSILKLIKTFADQGHSGTSAGYCLETFYPLAKFKPLGELTSNPSEWMKVNKGLYQSRRDPSCFSIDRRYYYNLDSKSLPKWKRLFLKHINGLRLMKLK